MKYAVLFMRISVKGQRLTQATEALLKKEAEKVAVFMRLAPLKEQLQYVQVQIQQQVEVKHTLMTQTNQLENTLAELRSCLETKKSAAKVNVYAQVFLFVSPDLMVRVWCSLLKRQPINWTKSWMRKNRK